MTIAQIQVYDVVKQYKQVKAVNGLSFSINKGEIFALLGPNGAGKSSLVRMLIGFTTPDSGEIKVNLHGNFTPHIPKQYLGYLPEDRGLYLEKSVSKNLLYFARLRGVNKSTATERIDFWLGKFDLIDRKDDSLKSLSKGNQQKVQLITAIIHEPEIVLLDEPFSGLDPINQEKVVTFLSQLKDKGMTVVFSAHQMSMVEKLADRMLLMNKGQAVLYGSLDDIKAASKVGFTLTAQFDNELDVEQADTVLTDYHFNLSKENSLVITLNSAIELPQLTAELNKLGNLIQINSQQFNLHQLYLQAVQQDESMPVEECKEQQYA